MARGINKVILIGNLGQDPELRYTGTGSAVCNMRIATTEAYRNQGGESIEKTEWHSVVAWGRTAETCGKYLKKGSRVYFEGALRTGSWQDRDGNTRYKTEVNVREMMMLDRRGDSSSGEQYSSREESQKPAPAHDQRPSAHTQQPATFGQQPPPDTHGTNEEADHQDDDLPF